MEKKNNVQKVNLKNGIVKRGIWKLNKLRKWRKREKQMKGGKNRKLSSLEKQKETDKWRRNKNEDQLWASSLKIGMRKI